MVTLVANSKDALISLNLSHCSNVNSLKSLITHRCRNLEELNVSFMTKLPGQALTDAFKCMGRNLKTLNLSATRITNDSLKSIFDLCRQLTVLDISDCPQLTDGAFDVCKSFVKANVKMSITSINLSSTSLGDRSLTSLIEATTSLKSINITKCPKMTSQFLQDLSQRSFSECLYLDGSQVGDRQRASFLDVFRALLQNNPNLTTLHLTNAPFLADECLETMAECCPLMEELNVRGAANLTDLGISMLASLEHLTHLNLSTCPRLTDSGVSSLALSLHKLESLDVSTMNFHSDQIFSAIADTMTHLRVLRMNNNPRLTGLGLKKLITKQGDPLEEVVLNNCSGISKDAVLALKLKFPKCQVSAIFG